MSKVLHKSATAYGMDGRVGNIVYYQNGGETNAMIHNDAPKKNKSTKQVTNQCKWTNIVQLWKAAINLLCGCFQYKGEKQSDFNLFLKRNMRHEPAVYLTKQVADNKGSVITSYQISEGDLMPVRIEIVDGHYATDILIGDLQITADTTIKDLSDAIVSHSSDELYEYGDQITLYRCAQKVDAASGTPYVRFACDELVLSNSNKSKVWEVLSQDGFENINGYLGKSELPEYFGFAYVHSSISKEKKNFGELLVSTQHLIVNNPLLDNYTGSDALKAALQSYGAEEEKVIVPNSDGESRKTGHIDDKDLPTSKYRLTVQSESLDKGTVTGGGMFEEGANPTFSAIPKAGYEFEGWYRDGEKFSEEATCTDFDMPAANVTVIAKFSAVAATHTITLTAGANGKVKVGDGEPGTTATGTVEDGGTIVINAIADSGYQFQKWSDNNMQNPRTLTNVTEDVELTATFESEE